MPDPIVARARQLRREKTIPERKLWRELRNLKPLGIHFRQQAPVGRYIADFAELSACLIVELDGDSHSDPEAQKHDAERTRWLESQGFRVLRFGNRSVLYNLPGTIAEILLALGVCQLDSLMTSVVEKSPTPALPTRGRGKKTTPRQSP